MDESIFLYSWFSFDLQYHLILVGTNNVLHSSVKKILCTLWSLVLAKNSCNNISNSRRASFQTMLFLVTTLALTPNFCLMSKFCLKVMSCKLCNNRYMIASTQTTNTEIFAFMSVLVLKLLCRKVLFKNRK